MAPPPPPNGQPPCLSRWPPWVIYSLVGIYFVNIIGVTIVWVYWKFFSRQTPQQKTTEVEAPIDPLPDPLPDPPLPDPLPDNKDPTQSGIESTFPKEEGLIAEQDADDEDVTFVAIEDEEQTLLSSNATKERPPIGKKKSKKK
ncbi:hypothetical protein CAPTEDRAFT_191814 [Capitella teleta]|uniref:Uncharacterized protein n=1 Tax=Capitella teleta TaxID=283909 RepID=R7TYF6_CAPTE|nr:hypothetical protein CAPTEDRAFT_191814 [Capitella teleta]|eukprot:ELT98769.1 hypothetical protein CAPTEDRAFT_191814 [Capitella teleta]